MIPEGRSTMARDRTTRVDRVTALLAATLFVCGCQAFADSIHDGGFLADGGIQTSRGDAPHFVTGEAGPNSRSDSCGGDQGPCCNGLACNPGLVCVAGLCTVPSITDAGASTTDGGWGTADAAPVSCDDNNVCTEDLRENGQCVHRKLGMLVYRQGCYTSGDCQGAHAYTVSTDLLGACWSYELDAFRLVDPGIAAASLSSDEKMLHENYRTGSACDYMLSVIPGESGYTDLPLAAYCFSNQRPGTVPLHRLIWSGPPTRHFSTIYDSEVTDAQSTYGMAYDGITCYVCPP
jgi:hypothetical protein